jgi:hypothetical protein
MFIAKLKLLIYSTKKIIFKTKGFYLKKNKICNPFCFIIIIIFNIENILLT